MSKSKAGGKLKRLKMEAAAEIGMLQYVRENNDHYKGDVPAKVNGAHGGPIGGHMVKKMLLAEEERMASS